MSERTQILNGHDPDVHICEMCGKTKKNVSYVEDPYDADVYNKHNMRWLCDGCYDELCYDI
jgi:hypothetical protein